jgi:hypothetical protein
MAVQQAGVGVERACRPGLLSFGPSTSATRCSTPNRPTWPTQTPPRLYVFDGFMDIDGAKEPLDANNLLLRGSTLCKTGWAIGLAVNVGRDAKIVQNMTKAPRKVRDASERGCAPVRQKCGGSTLQHDGSSPVPSGSFGKLRRAAGLSTAQHAPPLAHAAPRPCSSCLCLRQVTQLERNMNALVIFQFGVLFLMSAAVAAVSIWWELTFAPTGEGALGSSGAGLGRMTVHALGAGPGQLRDTLRSEAVANAPSRSPSEPRPRNSMPCRAAAALCALLAGGKATNQAWYLQTSGKYPELQPSALSWFIMVRGGRACIGRGGQGMGAAEGIRPQAPAGVVWHEIDLPIPERAQPRPCQPFSNPLRLPQLLRFVILLGNLIPISLYVTLEVVKVFQCSLLLNADRKMYHRDTDTPFVCRTTRLNEELGQVGEACD